MIVLILLPLACLLSVIPSALAAEKGNIVASIKPLHSLVAGVMAGIGAPALLVKGTASPHDYALRPSDAITINRASLIIWTGGGMESFLEKPLGTLGKNARKIDVSGIPGVSLLPLQGGNGVNLHLWLDPGNAGAIVTAVSRTLAEIDPANRRAYLRNAGRVLNRLENLDGKLRSRLSPVSSQPFAVYHDAYAYLTKRYQLNFIAALTDQAERPPGARRVGKFRKSIERAGARCFFMAPDTPAKSVHGMIADTGIRIRVLDPVGYNLRPGPDLYFRLMENLSRSMAGCLSRQAGG